MTRARRYARPSPLQDVALAAARVGPFGAARLEPLGECPARGIAALLEQATLGARVVPARDPGFYAWRYAPPSGGQTAVALVNRGKVRAVAALERRDEAVALLDVVAPRQEHAWAVSAIALASGARRVAMLLTEGCDAARSMWRAGFGGREAKAFQVLTVTDDAAPEALFNPEGWFYTWGDGDMDVVL